MWVIWVVSIQLCGGVGDSFTDGVRYKSSAKDMNLDPATSCVIMPVVVVADCDVIEIDVTLSSAVMSQLEFKL